MDRSESRRVDWVVACVPLVASGWSAATVKADIDPLSGIDFVTVGAVGNAPWAGDGTPGDRAIGRGSVGYEYRIGKYEVTTAQWVEFMNAAFDRPANDRIPHLTIPGFWGAAGATPNTPGGLRWSVPTGNEMRAVGNIDWRNAAIYCNWLHNGKSFDRTAFLSGAYDVSTFGYTGEFGDIFTDQDARSPGARYFIPTWDEHLKASHYDPTKINSDGSVGGWWRYNNGSDAPHVYGPPGVLVNGLPTTANGRWDVDQFPGFNPFTVPLGSYTSTSPWGLFDVAGGTEEWSESITTTSGGARRRVTDGTDWGHYLPPHVPSLDQIGWANADFPSIDTYDHGFRIASVVPVPGTLVPTLGVVLVLASRKRVTHTPAPRRGIFCLADLPRATPALRVRCGPFRPVVKEHPCQTAVASPPSLRSVMGYAVMRDPMIS